ncbi:MAG: NAD(P)-dependent oxidoreductase [Crocinitomicaceae bacterium]|nr:NAD(P)-dependent oxidoreductase [Crocinitomicaceae bacterium]
MKILVLGITGMLGHKAFNHFSFSKDFQTYGTLRNKKDISKYFDKNQNKKNIFSNVDVLNTNDVFKLIDKIKPDIIINCIGIIKQLKETHNSLLSIELNALFPHKLANFIEGTNSRLIHISTDCVFSGAKGNYLEEDHSDAQDIYGKTKFLGELINYNNSITIRTSIIGPELKGKLSLLEWFLSQKQSINGYTNAIYSGFSTNELVNIIENYIIPNPSISGLYNVASDPISKYELLKIISKVYHKEIIIIPFDKFKSDKSLNCGKFIKDFNFRKKTWFQMILEMKSG